MTTVPTQRHPAAHLPKAQRQAYPTTWICPTCKARVRVCDKPACITAEIDDDFRQSLNGDDDE